MKDRYYIGVDCGSTMVKAAIFDADGKEWGVSSRKVQHIYLHPDWTENDAEKLFENVCEVIRNVLKSSGIDPAKIVSIACCGHGNGVYLTDAEGNPTRNGVISSDGRARKYIEQWTNENVLDKIRAKTMQAIWPAQPNALLRWFAEYEPDVLARTKWMFACKDYIRFRLTGEAFMERTDMSGTSLIDVGTGEYDDEVLAAWGLTDLRNIMPPLKNSADICGKITEQVAAKTDLMPGTPVAGGMFDIDACGLAVGMVDETQLCLIAGTWGNNQYISKTPVVSSDVFMTSCFSKPGYYLMLEGSATSASNLEWMVSQFFESDKELLLQKGEISDTKNIYAHCVELVGQSKPEDTGIIFLPFLYGCPTSLDGKACLFGIDGRHTRSQVLRAVLEGIVFGHYWHVKRLLKFRDKPQTLQLTGGATNSEVWSQMFADIFQTTVEIPAGTELGCFGAAICAAVAVSDFGSWDEAVKTMVKIDRVYKPDPNLAELYRTKYERYEKLLETLQPVWGELAWK